MLFNQYMPLSTLIANKAYRSIFTVFLLIIFISQSGYANTSANRIHAVVDLSHQFTFYADGRFHRQYLPGEPVATNWDTLYNFDFSNANLLILPGCEPLIEYLPRDITTIKDFLAQGGGVVIFGSSADKQQNKLLKNFGCEFQGSARGPYKAQAEIITGEIQGRADWLALEAPGHWQILITDANDKTVMANRKIGKGTLVVAARGLAGSQPDASDNINAQWWKPLLAYTASGKTVDATKSFRSRGIGSMEYTDQLDTITISYTEYLRPYAKKMGDIYQRIYPYLEKRFGVPLSDGMASHIGLLATGGGGFSSGRTLGLAVFWGGFPEREDNMIEFISHEATHSWVLPFAEIWNEPIATYVGNLVMMDMGYEQEGMARIQNTIERARRIDPSMKLYDINGKSLTDARELSPGEINNIHWGKSYWIFEELRKKNPDFLADYFKTKRQLALPSQIRRYGVNETVAVLSVAMRENMFPWFAQYGFDVDQNKSLIKLDGYNWDSTKKEEIVKNLRMSNAVLEIINKEQGLFVQINGNEGGNIFQPAEGLWSIAMDWKDGWPAQWYHSQAQTVEQLGPWLVLTGEIKTPQGNWLMRDSYIPEGQRIRVIRRWQWTGDDLAEKVTLSVRWHTPNAGSSIMLPGFCYYGNPSGAKSGQQRVPIYTGKTGEMMFCEEHRLPMSFAALEWPQQEGFAGAALHTLPSLASHSNKADQWWSLGVATHQQYSELALLSGACSLNGMHSYVKANQGKFFAYPDAYLNVPSKSVIEKTFYLQAYPVQAKGSGFFSPMQESINIFQPYSLAGLPGYKEIMDAKYFFAKSRWHQTDKSAGFRMYPHNNLYVMGWAGQAAAPGYALLVLSEQLKAPEAVDMAQKTLDHLAQTPFNDNGFLLRYNPDTEIWDGQDPVSQGQAMENFARAINYARSRDDIATEKWEAFLRRACDVHTSRIMNENWKPRSTCEAFIVSPLSRAYKLFGNESYKKAAIKVAQYYADRHLDMTEPYWGGTLDASCEDKEGAWAGFQAFLAVYEMTGEEKYLKWAEHAMNVTLSYTFIWDIDMPAGRLRDHGLKSRGWTTVSAQNQHLDVFGVIYTPEIYRMGQYLQRDDLKKIAKLMFISCGQMLDPYGSQGEQLNHTNFVQGMPINDVYKMRGTYREDWTVFWMTAHFLNAAAQFREMDIDLTK